VLSALWSTWSTLLGAALQTMSLTVN